MRGYSRPEFLNRLDDIVLFEPLTEVEIEHFVSLIFNDLRARLADRKVTLELTENARRYIDERGLDPVYGARPLRRFIAPRSRDSDWARAFGWRRRRRCGDP